MIDVIDIGRVLMFTVDSVRPGTFAFRNIDIFCSPQNFHNNYDQLHGLSSHLAPAVFSFVEASEKFSL